MIEEDKKILAAIEYHKKAIEIIDKRIKKVNILLLICFLYLLLLFFRFFFF